MTRFPRLWDEPPLHLLCNDYEGRHSAVTRRVRRRTNRHMRNSRGPLTQRGPVRVSGRPVAGGVSSSGKKCPDIARGVTQPTDSKVTNADIRAGTGIIRNPPSLMGITTYH